MQHVNMTLHGPLHDNRNEENSLHDSNNCKDHDNDNEKYDQDASRLWDRATTVESMSEGPR